MAAYICAALASEQFDDNAALALGRLSGVRNVPTHRCHCPVIWSSVRSAIVSRTVVAPISVNIRAAAGSPTASLAGTGLGTTLGSPLDLVTDPLAPSEVPGLEPVALGSVMQGKVFSDSLNLSIGQSFCDGIIPAFVWKGPPLR
jgi:hypothetical protein